MYKHIVDNIKNPEIFEENRLKAHSDHEFYADVDEYYRGKSSFIFLLNGVWKCNYSVNFNQIPEGFEKEEFKCKDWPDIRIPSHIQLEGLDRPHYTNVTYPWDGLENLKSGETPEKFNPTVSLVKYFTLPTDFGDRLILRMNGVESAVAVWLNGEYVGYSEDSFTPSEFDISEYIKQGENKLALLVPKWCAGSWLEDQDFFRFSGVFRDIYIYAKPNLHIEDLDIKTEFNIYGDNANLDIATFKLNLFSTGQGKALIRLYDGVDKSASNFMILNTFDRTKVIEKDVALSEGANEFSYEVHLPKLWSAEKPVLYTLLIELYSEFKKTEIIIENVGFRVFFKDTKNIMKLNNVRLVFNGVNRHEFSAINGRVVSVEDIITDLTVMKRNNINAIRTSHYPNDSSLYKLCDIYGLYIIDETNMETHGTWTPYKDGIKPYEYVIPGERKEWQKLLLDRANSMYKRDRNRPCILIWSLGNESFGGSIIFDMAEFFRQADNTRLVHYEGVYNDRSYPDTSDIESRMYPPLSEVKEYLEEHRDKPFIMCEYTHAMGNSCGGMQLYTEYAYEDDLYQGGFIWDYIDQSLITKNSYGEDYMAYGGDFFDRPSDYNFSGNGIVYGDRTPSPKMQAVKYNYRPFDIKLSIKEGKIEIENRYMFTDLEEFNTCIEIYHFGKKLRGEVLQFSLPPHKKKQFFSVILTEYEKLWKIYRGELVVRVSIISKDDRIYSQRGMEVSFKEGYVREGENDLITENDNTIRNADAKVLADRDFAVDKPFEVIEGYNNIGVRGDDFFALFSIPAGGLVSYKYGGDDMLTSVPRPNFWRAPVDNEIGSNAPFREAVWKTAMYGINKKPTDESTRWDIQRPKIERTDTGIRIIYTYYFPKASSADIIYEVFGDGTIKMTLVYEKPEKLPYMPDFGFIFKMPGEYNELMWYGLGSEETYEDRLVGAKLDIYSGRVSEQGARYLVPQESGTKSNVRFAKIVNKRGRGLLIVGEDMAFSAMPHTPGEIEEALHSFELGRSHVTVIKTSNIARGVGGDDSWGATALPQFCIDTSKPHSIYIKGI